MKKQGIMLIVLMVLVVFLFADCAGSGKKTEENVVFWDSALLQNVTKITDDGLSKGWARVSPDGTKLIYSEYTKADWNIVLLRDVNVSSKTLLVSNANNPSWYENNNNFLYVVTENGSNKIVRSAISGGGKTYITRNNVGSNDEMPTIRNGLILFDTDGRIYSMKENGNEITILGEGHSPSWHPFENKFVFIRVEDGHGAVYEMDLDSTQVTQIHHDPEQSCALPSFSGDGQYILFQKRVETKVTGKKATFIGGLFKKMKAISGTQTNWQIFAMKADGTEMSPLTTGSVDTISPSWDKNNNLYFIATTAGKPEVYRARINIIN